MYGRRHGDSRVESFLQADKLRWYIYSQGICSVHRLCYFTWVIRKMSVREVEDEV